MAEVLSTTGAVILAGTVPAAVAANVAGVPLDAILCACLGAAIVVARGERITPGFPWVLGAIVAFATSLGIGALLGSLGAYFACWATEKYFSFKVPDGLMRMALAFVLALLAQQLLNAVGQAIEKARIPGLKGE